MAFTATPYCVHLSTISSFPVFPVIQPFIATMHCLFKQMKGQSVLLHRSRNGLTQLAWHLLSSLLGGASPAPKIEPLPELEAAPPPYSAIAPPGSLHVWSVTLQGICQLAHSWGGYFTEAAFKSWIGVSGILLQAIFPEDCQDFRRN